MMSLKGSGERVAHKDKQQVVRKAGGASGNRVRMLLEKMYVRKGDGALSLSDFLSDKALTAHLASTTFSHDFSEKFQNLHLSPRQRGVLSMGASSLYEYMTQPAFDPELVEEVLPQGAGLLGLALPEDGWLYKKSHPLNQLLAEVSKLVYGWYPRHPQAKDIKQQVRIWLEQLAQQEPAEEVLRRVRQWMETFESRRQKLRQRVVQAEEGALRLAYARSQSSMVVNRMVAGRPLPDFIAQSIQPVWQHGLQWIALNEGVGGATWNQAVRALGLLVWSVQPDAAEAKSKEKLSRTIDELNDQLPPLFAKMLADEAVAEQEFEQVEAVHVFQLMGRELNYVEVAELEATSYIDQSGARLSQDLLDDIANLSFDDWFLVQESGARVQLLLKQDDYKQLLFVNQLGMKELICSFEEFAWKFSVGELQRLPDVIALESIVAEQLSDLSAVYKQKLHKQKEEQEKQRRKEEEIRLLSREKAEKEARRLAEEHARLEEERLREANKHLYAEQERREQAAMEWGADVAERRRKIRLLITGLPLETRFSFYDENGGMVRRKLTVMMPSSGKYIFVDQVGQDRIELMRNELVEGLVTGAIVVEQDKNLKELIGRR